MRHVSPLPALLLSAGAALAQDGYLRDLLGGVIDEPLRQLGDLGHRLTVMLGVTAALAGLAAVALLAVLLRLRRLQPAPPRADDIRSELAELRRAVETLAARPPVDLTPLVAALAALRDEPDKASPAPAESVPPPSPPPVGESASASREPWGTVVEGLIPPESAADFIATLRAVRDVPMSIETAVAEGRGAEALRARAAELDRGLYTRFDADDVARAWPGLTAAQSAELAAWLRAEQAAAVERLRALGVQRIATTVGSPFEAERVVPDPDEPPKPTGRRELDGRVAGVRPGRGGYLLAGQMICPTRAQRYVYDSNAPD